MRRFLVGLVLMVSVFAGLSFTAPREAAAMRCDVVNPIGGGCLHYRPDFPPGGWDCVAPPGAGQVNLYTAADHSGYCVTIPAHMGWWSFTSANGWFGPYYVKSIWTGPTASGGYVCTGTNGGGTCYPMWAGYDYQYFDPPYSGSQPGWKSIVVP